MIRGSNPSTPTDPPAVPRPRRPTIAAATARRGAGVLAAVTLGVAGVAGCGGQHTERECGLDYCLVTFDRGVDAQASVLGVPARLVGSDADTVTVQVAGEQIVLATGDPAARVGGLYVSVEAVNGEQAVVRIGRTRSS